MQSPKYSLNKTDLLKILKQGGYVVGASLVAFLLSIVPNLDLGQYTSILIPLIVMGLNAIDRYFKGEQANTIIDTTNPLN